MTDQTTGEKQMSTLTWRTAGYVIGAITALTVLTGYVVTIENSTIQNKTEISKNTESIKAIVIDQKDYTAVKTRVDTLAKEQGMVRDKVDDLGKEQAAFTVQQQQNQKILEYIRDEMREERRNR